MRSHLLGFVTLTALVCAPLSAEAQFAERLSLTLEGGAGTQLASPQSDEYGFGFSFGGRFALRVAGPVALHAFGSYWSWGSNDAQLAKGVLTAFGGGLRIAPRVGGAGQFVLDADVGYALTGSDDTANRTRGATALVFGGGIGWLFPLGDVFSLGPMARVQYLTSLGSESAGDRDRALFWTFSLALNLHGARTEERVRPSEGDEPVGGGAPTGARLRAMEDTDHDGIPDVTDRCVTQPESRNGFQDDDGCPDNVPNPDDSDADGVASAADRCPEQPEDLDGFEDADGCPEPDNDRDGVPDAQDQCADAMETRNGFQDDDGCADTNPNAAAIIEGSRIVLSQTVLFAGARVAPGSTALLDALAGELRAHPEIRRVRVECRTDEGGGEAANLRASNDCARAVVRHVRRAGIVKRRIRGQGAGSLNAPAGAPRTQVDVIIVDPAGPIATGPTAVPGGPLATPTEAPEAGGRHGRHGRRGRHGRGRRRHH